MREEEAPSSADVTSWEERRLCPDGGCVGVVGDDGACTTCGRVDPEAARRIDERHAERAVGADDEGDEGDDEGDGDEARAGSEAIGARGEDAAAQTSAGEGDGDEWQQRKLCEDGGCVGVVIDGRCTTCAKAQ